MDESAELDQQIKELTKRVFPYGWSPRFLGDIKRFAEAADQTALARHVTAHLNVKSPKSNVSKEQYVVLIILFHWMQQPKETTLSMLLHRFLGDQLLSGDVYFLVHALLDDHIPLPRSLVYAITERLLLNIEMMYAKIVNDFRNVPARNTNKVILFLTIHYSRKDLNTQNKEMIGLILAHIKADVPRKLREDVKDFLVRTFLKEIQKASERHNVQIDQSLYTELTERSEAGPRPTYSDAVDESGRGESEELDEASDEDTIPASERPAAAGESDEDGSESSNEEPFDGRALSDRASEGESESPGDTGSGSEGDEERLSEALSTDDSDVGETSEASGTDSSDESFLPGEEQASREGAANQEAQERAEGREDEPRRESGSAERAPLPGDEEPSSSPEESGEAGTADRSAESEDNVGSSTEGSQNGDAAESSEPPISIDRAQGGGASFRFGAEDDHYQFTYEQPSEAAEGIELRELDYDGIVESEEDGEAPQAEELSVDVTAVAEGSWVPDTGEEAGAFETGEKTGDAESGGSDTGETEETEEAEEAEEAGAEEARTAAEEEQEQADEHPEGARGRARSEDTAWQGTEPPPEEGTAEEPRPGEGTAKRGSAESGAGDVHAARPSSQQRSVSKQEPSDSKPERSALNRERKRKRGVLIAALTAGAAALAGIFLLLTPIGGGSTSGGGPSSSQEEAPAASTGEGSTTAEAPTTGEGNEGVVQQGPESPAPEAGGEVPPPGADEFVLSAAGESYTFFVDQGTVRWVPTGGDNFYALHTFLENYNETLPQELQGLDELSWDGFLERVRSLNPTVEPLDLIYPQDSYVIGQTS